MVEEGEEGPPQALLGMSFLFVGATFLARVQLEQHGNRLTLIPTK